MQLVLDEVLKNIENKSDFKKLERQVNNLRMMIIIQFICLILIAISLISIIGNDTTSSMSTFDMILSVSGLLAILIVLLSAKLINI